MPLDVIAVPRSRGIVLAAVLEEGAATKPGLLSLVSEDGARFRFPSEHAIERVVVDDGRDDEDPLARLADLRARLTPFPHWIAVHGQLDEGDRVTVRELGEHLGMGDPEGRLSIALGAASCAPWMRRDGAEFVVASAREALEQLFHLSDQRFREKGDDVVADWWPKRLEGVPDGWMDPGGSLGVQARIGLERANFFDPDYVPDEGVAAAAALAALVTWAMEGETAADNRGRELAKRLGLPDDPDFALEEIVACGALGADADPAPHRAGLAGGFSDDALAEAAAVQPATSEGRADLTSLVTVAVDDAGTHEVDDAVSLRRTDGGWELLVHIADVASSVRPGSALDAAAAARASSLFLPDRAVLMLPRELVEGRLSLAVGEARPAVTGVFGVDDTGTVRSARFVRSIVTLDRHVTYAGSRDTASLAASATDGEQLVALCAALRGARKGRGARVLDIPSAKVVVEDGVPRVGRRVQDTPGDLVVSESMVLFNAQAGEALAEAGVAATFRGQDGAVRPGRAVPDRDDPLYVCRIRRTFAPTETSSAPLVHGGLGVGAYAQCTSPIRRYADLVNQRQLIAVAEKTAPPLARPQLDDLLTELQPRERRVRRASDMRAAYWTARAVDDAGARTLRGFLSKAPRKGLGSVWVPELLKELPLRAPKGWRAPPEGTEADWTVAAIRPFRGRIELAPTE